MRRTSSRQPAAADDQAPDRQGPRRGGNGLAATGTAGATAAKPRPYRPKADPRADQSAVQRDQLLAEWTHLDSADAAASWAHGSCPPRTA